jgi:hypothetical protein
MHETIVVTKLLATHWFEAEATVEFMGARIAGKRIDHDCRDRRVGETNLKGETHHGFAIAPAKTVRFTDPDVEGA